MGKSHDLATIADDGLDVASLSVGSGGLTVGTDQLAVDGSGRVTMPYQPSFNASRSVDLGINASNVNSKLLFDQAIHNVGSHYDGSTGRFTCPVSGVYFIAFSVRLDFLSGAYAWVQTFVNGVKKTDAGAPNFISQDTGTYTTCAASGLLSLSAGDYVEIFTYVSGDSSWDFENASSFSGHLIG